MPCGEASGRLGPELTAHLGAGLLHQLQQRGAGLRGAAIAERRAQRLKISLQRLEAVHEPPPAAAARLELALLLRRPNESRHLRSVCGAWCMADNAHVSIEEWACPTWFAKAPGPHDSSYVSGNATYHVHGTLKGGHQRGVVGNPQVAPQPEQRRGYFVHGVRGCRERG